MALPDGSVHASERWPRQAVLVALAGGCVSVALSVLSAWRQQTAHREHFEAQARALHSSAEERLESLAATALALAAHWSSEPPADARDFETHARFVSQASGSASGLLWCDFDANRAGAWNVRFAHPADKWGALVGLDPSALVASSALRADGVRVTTLPHGDGRRAIVATSEITAGSKRGLLCALADTGELAAALEAQPWARGLDVEIDASTSSATHGGFQLSLPLEHGPADWRMHVNSTAQFEPHGLDITPWALLALGLTFTAVLAQRLRALELRTRALSRANAELYSEIAERHNAQTRLRETQRALSTLVANLPGVAYRCGNTPSWPMEFISDGCAALTGHPARDFVEGVISYGERVIHPDDRTYVWNSVQQALDSQRPFQLVYRIVTSAGQTKWVWEQGRGVYSKANELLAVEGLITDITERKLAEEGLKHQMRFVDAIIDSLPGNFYVFEESGRFVRWNQNVETVTGYSPLELAAMNPMDFFEGEHRTRVERAVRQVFEEGRTLVDASLRTKQGRSVPFHFTGVLFSHDGVRYLVGVGIDVSELERAREEQERLNTQLLHTAKLESMGVMASGIAHDFNNVLTIVAASTGMAQSSVEPGSEAHNLLAEALSATRNASEITRQLLSLARGDSPQRGPLVLTELVGGLEKLLRASIKRRVELAFELAPDLPPIQADPAQVRQLVLNLALNAGEACVERGGLVRIATGQRSYEAADLASPAFRGHKQTGRHVYVEVVDDGTGMDAATLARLGEPFFTTRVAGRGLGLAAVLGILRTHGGWLELASTVGEGTTVRACLPATGVNPGALRES